MIDKSPEAVASVSNCDQFHSNKRAALKDPSGLFNSSLDGNTRRALYIHEGDEVEEAALKDLIRAGVALGLKGKIKPKPHRASSKRAE